MPKSFRFFVTCVWIYASSVLPSTLILSDSGLALEPSSVQGQAEATTITAQKMTVRNKENKAYFEGTVVLTKGSLVVHSDQMVVTFKAKESDGGDIRGDESKKKPNESGLDPLKAGSGGGTPSIGGGRSIGLVEATGHVQIEKDGGTATCQKAIYYEQEAKIVLTGNPIAWQNGNRVSGKVITLYLTDDRSVVEGESRVFLEPERQGGGR